MKKQNLSRKKFSKRVSKNLRKLSKKSRKVGGIRIKQKKSRKRIKGRTMMKRTRNMRGGSSRQQRIITEAAAPALISQRINLFFTEETEYNIKFTVDSEPSHSNGSYYRDTLGFLPQMFGNLRTFISEIEAYDKSKTEKILLIDGANVLRNWRKKGHQVNLISDALYTQHLRYYDKIIATYKSDEERELLQTTVTRNRGLTGKVLELPFMQVPTPGEPFKSHAADDLCLLAVATILQNLRDQIPINRKLGMDGRNSLSAAGEHRERFELNPSGIYFATGDKMSNVKITLKGEEQNWNQIPVGGKMYFGPDPPAFTYVGGYARGEGGGGEDRRDRRDWERGRSRDRPSDRPSDRDRRERSRDRRDWERDRPSDRHSDRDRRERSRSRDRRHEGRYDRR